MLGVDLERKVVRCDDGDVSYDYLILAAGSANNYFGGVFFILIPYEISIVIIQSPAVSNIALNQSV